MFPGTITFWSLDKFRISSGQRMMRKLFAVKFIENDVEGIGRHILTNNQIFLQI